MTEELVVQYAMRTMCEGDRIWSLAGDNLYDHPAPIEAPLCIEWPLETIQLLTWEGYSVCGEKPWYHYYTDILLCTEEDDICVTMYSWPIIIVGNIGHGHAVTMCVACPTFWAMWRIDHGYRIIDIAINYDRPITTVIDQYDDEEIHKWRYAAKAVYTLWLMPPLIPMIFWYHTPIEDVPMMTTQWDDIPHCTAKLAASSRWARLVGHRVGLGEDMKPK